ncbi:MAG: VanW family protein, partial [Clostridia bacterium]|nr:VanW family protein [Clostridia bacterium]
MKTKSFLIILLPLVFLLLGCRAKTELNVCLTCENETLLNKKYAISLTDDLNIKRYGSFEKYREKTGLSFLEFLRKLNENAANDVEETCRKTYVSVVEPDFFYLGDGTFSFSGGKPGRSASAEETARSIIASGGKYSGEISYRTLSPVLTADDLKIRTEKIASFSSDYSSSSPERKHNIALAVKRLDNRVVEGRKSLSFNETVGKRTKENGFQEAGVIAYGEFTRGIGGGVCQVSTTLYDAWMAAGLSAI